MHQKLLQVKQIYIFIILIYLIFIKEIILLQNAEKLLMKRTGQRGSGRPPIHCDINVEIILSDTDQVIVVFLTFRF